MTEEKAVTGGEAPAWMVGTGLDTDMKGDTRPGAGAGQRFWIPKGTERKIIFLTEGNAAPVIWEHQVKLGGDWRNWFTCLTVLGVECPLCAWADEHRTYNRSKVAVFTVIDCHEFVRKDGTKVKNQRRMLAAKKDTTELFKRMYLKRLEADQGLRGAMYNVYRTNSDKSASVGEQFEFEKMVDLSSLPESEEFNYSEVLAPDPGSIKSAVQRLEREMGKTSGRTEGTESKVDFT